MFGRGMETKDKIKCRRKLSLYKNAVHVGRQGAIGKLLSIQSAEHNWCPGEDQMTIGQQEIKRGGHDGDCHVDLLVRIFGVEEIPQERPVRA